MGTAIKHHVPDWVKPSFVIFDIRALGHSGLKRYRALLNSHVTDNDTVKFKHVCCKEIPNFSM